jgi:hypothetical protein
MAQGTEGMEGPGKVSRDRVNDIINNYRGNEMDDNVKADLRNQLGTKLEPFLHLDRREVTILNGLPPEAAETLFDLCTRAASSGGNVEYERHEEGYPMDKPKMEIVYTEVIEYNGGVAKTVGSVKLTCWK